CVVSRTNHQSRRVRVRELRRDRQRAPARQRPAGGDLRCAAPPRRRSDVPERPGAHAAFGRERAGPRLPRAARRGVRARACAGRGRPGADARADGREPAGPLLESTGAEAPARSRVHHTKRGVAMTMLPTAKRLDRRSFLVGAGGIAIGLPFLEGLQERSAWAEGDAPTFGLFICTANGVVQAQNGEPERFWPAKVGPLTSENLAAVADERCTGLLADYADRLLIVRGVQYPGPGTGCSHAQGLVQC